MQMRNGEARMGAMGVRMFRELTDDEAGAVTGGNGPVGVYYDLEKKQYILTDRVFYQPGTIFVGTL